MQFHYVLCTVKFQFKFNLENNTNVILCLCSSDIPRKLFEILEGSGEMALWGDVIPPFNFLKIRALFKLLLNFVNGTTGDRKC